MTSRHVAEAKGGEAAYSRRSQTQMPQRARRRPASSLSSAGGMAEPDRLPRPAPTTGLWLTVVERPGGWGTQNSPQEPRVQVSFLS